MLSSFLFPRFAVCFLVTAAICATCSARSPVLPLARAEAALNGLLLYFTQQESGPSALPPLKGCPCFSCAGKNCSIPECRLCSAKADNPCPSTQSNGCYTTKKEECSCNRPPGPVPPNATSPAKFFFSCGQIGVFEKNSDVAYSSCVCETDWPGSCITCYRWWSAVALEAAANYLIEAKLPLNESLPSRIMSIAESMWIHSPYNANWDASITPVFVDDFGWYSLAYLRMFDLTGDDKWRQRAAAIHDWSYKYGYDHRQRNDSVEQCGGFWWNLELTKRFKDSISIVEVLHVAARLATTITPALNRSHYLDSAISIWNWIFEFDNGTGLLAPNGIMSTGALPEWCCSANSAANDSLGQKCVNSRVPGMTYNHGILMSSAALLYNVTGNDEYLLRGTALLNTAYRNLTNSEGAVRDLQRGSRDKATSNAECNSYNGDPGSDFFSFKGIFATHLAYFTQTLNWSGVLTEDINTKVLSIIVNSSNNVWTKSIVNPPFKNNNPCSSLVTESTSAKYPKFHWWWTTSNVSIETSPNPMLWFEKTSNIFCNYNETSVVHWKGKVATVDECNQLCANTSYANCTKFMFSTSTDTRAQLPVSSANCPCFTCAGERCYHPDCQYCNTQSKGCPKKTSPGCYTTANKACTCSSSKPAINCWLYKVIPPSGFDRESGHSCGQTSYDYTVVARRPFSPNVDAMTTCKNRCGGNVTKFQGDSSMLCYCDAACSLHLDCCLDYVEYCLPKDQQAPTCFNSCNATTGNISHPIRGGGYCYCDSGCMNGFTDNNSYGGCCGDYMWHCGGGQQDQLCLDVRTQTQAVSVFVAHHALT